MGRRRVLSSMLCIVLGSLGVASSLAQELPASIHTEDVPPIPPDIDWELNRFRNDVVADFQGWHAGRREMLFLAGSGDTSQVFGIRAPNAERRQLTDLGTAVSWIRPNPRDDRVIVGTDPRGDERYQLSLPVLASDSNTRLTAGRNHNRYPIWSRDGQQLAFSCDARNETDLDIHVFRPDDPSTCKRLTSLHGRCIATDWSASARRVAVVQHLMEEEDTRVHLIDVASGDDRTLPTRPGWVWDVRFSLDERSLFWLTNHDSDFVHLARYDLASEVETSLTKDVGWDIEDFDLSADNTRLVYLVNEDGQSRLQVLDPRDGNAIPCPRFADGIIRDVTFRGGSREFAFQWSNHRMSQGIYSFDLDTGKGVAWVKQRESEDRLRRPSPARLIHFRSFDGLRISAYVKGAGMDFTGRRPVLIDIHGGPFSQHRPSYSSWDEYMTKLLGVTIIRPNVRGSTGYGRHFEHLDDGVNRQDAVKDIGILLDWIARQPDLDPDRVAVRGGSYGGFMSLASLVSYGHRLRAGIDVCGISNFVTFMEKAAPPAVLSHRREYGDERDASVVRYLNSVSPLTYASQIRKPLLVIHGVNDPRVAIGEADQIVSRVRSTDTPVWYVKFDGEGHNLTSREHANYASLAEIVFLKKFLIEATP